MIKLKQIIHYPETNSVEATWVREFPATIDENGTSIPSRDETIRCHSYADVQMDMLEADLGEDVSDHAELIATVRANIKPPDPISAEQIRANILSQIDSMERSQLMPRATREFMLQFMEQTSTPEQLEQNFGYKTIKSFDMQIKALRDQLILK